MKNVTKLSDVQATHGVASDLDRAIASDRVSKLGEIAEALGTPVWVLMIPNLPPHVLENGAADLQKLVSSYLSRDPSQSLDSHPIVQAMNGLRGDLFGPIAVVGVARESVSPGDNYNLWRALGDAVNQFEGITAKMENVAYHLAEQEVSHG